MFKGGDVVYFKECKNSSHRKAQGARFRGVGFGIFLGAVGPFEKDPKREDTIKLVGACGYLTFDDVADFLGDEAAKVCIEKFETKYYPPKILGPDGKPALVSDEDKPPLERKLLLNPTDAARLRESMKNPGKVEPLLTVADLQNQLKSLTPGQIKKAVEDAKRQLKNSVTPEQESQITAKVCDALGVDPALLRDPTSEEAHKKEAPSDTKPPQGEAPPIFPKKQLLVPEGKL